ncbi:MAG: hypothetical protein KAW39_01000 [Thermoplasmata archaeon]|nr:hypothetical protein [Thermoplasmata archaeon]
MNDIDAAINKAKTDLFEYFSMSPSVVWKEEDLQSYLYHRLLIYEPRLKKRLHREFPVVRSFKNRDWAGMLDLAITEESNSNFRVLDVKVEYAIELKFLRNWETGSSPRSLAKFEKECREDVGKLRTRAVNFNDDTKKYFFALRLTDVRQTHEVRRIFEEMDWGGIEHGYIECYTDGSESQVL